MRVVAEIGPHLDRRAVDQFIQPFGVAGTGVAAEQLATLARRLKAVREEIGRLAI